MRSVGARAALLASCLAGLLLPFMLIARPWYRGWGADAQLRTAPLPGDGLLWQGAPRETRAIRIEAPAGRVWPWVAQIGQDRAGFYSYRVLENLVGCRMPDLDYLVPALQHWDDGDKLWMYPSDAGGGIGQAPLALHVPGRALVFYTRRPGTGLDHPPDGTWAFVVEPIDARASRLVMRSNARGTLGLLGAGFESNVFEPIHFAMERKMMEGIKARAEGRPVPAWRDDVQVALWAVTFALFVVSAILVLRGRAPGPHAVTFTAAGLLFAALTLLQPGVLLGTPLVALLGAATWLAGQPGWAGQRGSPRR